MTWSPIPNAAAVAVEAGGAQGHQDGGGEEGVAERALRQDAARRRRVAQIRQGALIIDFLIELRICIFHHVCRVPKRHRRETKRMCVFI